ncbi:MAG TPA: ABC transporter substrate-binding protein [Solirubrobacteraceae bacterium]|nr:ABC transporter substrate-binding protein [Solirubrobacteraceae bacterium]
MRRTKYALVLAGIAAALIAGCGGDDEGGAGTSGDQQTPAASKAISPDAANGATGTVNLCLPKDVSGAFTKTVAAFNKTSEVQATLQELPESADEQRNQLIQRSQARSPECDVMGIDVIWTAEFASQGWIQDLSQVVADRRDEFIPSTIETANYDGKYWALPHNSNAALLYYRTDQVDQAPATWEEVYEQAAANDGIVYQGAAYEGLTCDFLELLYSAGGEVLNADGTAPAVDSPETRQVLDFMVNGIKEGAAPRAVTTYMEEPSRQEFEAGRATFMRNWPYAYALGNQSKIKGKFDITTLPGYGGNPGAGVLGGTNLAISTYSENPGAALAVVNFFTGKEGQRLIGEGATPPATTAAYDVPSVRKAIGLPDEIRDAVSQAKPRPVSPVYPQISQAIYKNVNQALSGRLSTDEAVRAMSDDIEKALATF